MDIIYNERSVADQYSIDEYSITLQALRLRDTYRYTLSMYVLLPRANSES